MLLLFAPTKLKMLLVSCCVIPSKFKTHKQDIFKHCLQVCYCDAACAGVKGFSHSWRVRGTE